MEPNDVPFVGKLSDNLCLSGGAKGADVAWGEEAAKAGHQVIHWSFEGHKCHGAPEHTVKLDLDTLKQADERLEMANESLKRHLPYHKPWLINLLRRNWFQVQHADAVWIVGTLTERAVMLKEVIDNDYIPINRSDKLGIDGGTAWAAQMYWDKHREKVNKLKKITLLLDDLLTVQFKMILYNQDKDPTKRGFYFFDPALECWMAHKPLYRPRGIYAAIGSRNLLDCGKEFISNTFNNS